MTNNREISPPQTAEDVLATLEMATEISKSPFALDWLMHEDTYPEALINATQQLRIEKELKKQFPTDPPRLIEDWLKYQRSDMDPYSVDSILKHRVVKQLLDYASIMEDYIRRGIHNRGVEKLGDLSSAYTFPTMLAGMLYYEAGLFTSNKREQEALFEKAKYWFRTTAKDNIPVDKKEKASAYIHDIESISAPHSQTPEIDDKQKLDNLHKQGLEFIAHANLSSDFSNGVLYEEFVVFIFRFMAYEQRLDNALIFRHAGLRGDAPINQDTQHGKVAHDVIVEDRSTDTPVIIGRIQLKYGSQTHKSQTYDETRVTLLQARTAGDKFERLAMRRVVNDIIANGVKTKDIIEKEKKDGRRIAEALKGIRNTFNTFNTS